MKNSKSNLLPLAWGMTRVEYKIMTDADGVKWRVPTCIDGKPCEFLTKYIPDDLKHTFERLTIK